jgi:hypothetical protein
MTYEHGSSSRYLVFPRYGEGGSSSRFLVFPRYGQGGSTSAPKPITTSTCPDNLSARMRNTITVFRNGRDVQIAVNVPWRMEEPDEEVPPEGETP